LIWQARRQPSNRSQIEVCCACQTSIQGDYKMPQSISATQVKTIFLVCEAGMGSSLMTANALKQRLKAAKITDVAVYNKAVHDVPADAQVIVVHKGLARTVQGKLPNAVIIAFTHFVFDPTFDKLVHAIASGSDIVGSEI
jgi:mannitol-specific phosphotransferase system IIBC component